MAATRKWDDLYRNMDALSDEDRDEIALKVAIVGEVLAARKSAGLTQAELEKATGVKQAMIARLDRRLAIRRTFHRLRREASSMSI